MIYETKDSGERADMGNGGVRDTEKGKPRFDLVMPLKIPYEQQMLTRWASLMARGAEKYSQSNIEKLDTEFVSEVEEKLKWNHPVEYIKIERYTQKDTVEVVTKKSYEEVTRNSQKDKEKIVEIGEEEILKKLNNFREIGEKTQVKDSETKSQASYMYLDRGDLLQRQTHFFWKNNPTSVEYVLKNFMDVQNIWTMTIKQDLREDIYVMAATEAWECWETILKVLQKQFHILPDHQLKSSSTKSCARLTLQTPRNWELFNNQEALDRAKSSALRHMIQWINGETDEDHAAAVYFNIMAAEYVKYQLRPQVDVDVWTSEDHSGDFLLLFFDESWSAFDIEGADYSPEDVEGLMEALVVERHPIYEWVWQ